MTVVNPKSISGINSITMASGSDNLLTIHTTNTTERVRVNSDGDVIVGSGITVSPDGDIFATGVTTSTTFVGALTGNVTGNVTGNISSGTVAGSTGTFSSDVSVGGELQIADYIVHTGDGNTAIRFPSADTITAETSGNERLRIDSDGQMSLGGSSSNTFAGLQRFDIYNTSTADNYHGSLIRLITKNAAGNATASYDMVKYKEGTVSHNNNESSGAINFYAGGATRLQILSTGNINVNDGDLVFGTSGHGIDFSATANTSATGASMSSELLDDYEEGTFTPVLRTSGDATEPSYTQRQGIYTKVGRVVTWIARIDCSSTISSYSGVVQMYGLPFNAMVWSSYDWPGFCSLSYYNGLQNMGSSTNPRFLGPASGADYVRLHTFSNSNDTSNNGGNVIANGSLFILGGTYQAT